MPGAEPTRRGILNALWIGLGLLASGEIIWVVLSFLKPRSSTDAGVGEDQVHVAGQLEDFEAGSVTAFQRGKFYLVRLTDGGFLALSRECTHLGCTVPWIEEEDRFVCPCHASAFTVEGEVLSPPAPRPLDALPVRIENGIVKVDTSQPVRRSEVSRTLVVYS
ncbi:MAG: Rieske (2Fe-2S) protein [bacterium]|nr:Rieske (2Fe-2S) protein [bacterium]